MPKRRVFLVTLNAVTPGRHDRSADVKAQRDQIEASLSGAMGRDVFELFTRAAQAEVGIIARPQRDRRRERPLQ